MPMLSPKLVITLLFVTSCRLTQESLSFSPYRGQVVQNMSESWDWGWLDWTSDIDGDDTGDILIYDAPKARLTVLSGASGTPIADFSTHDTILERKRLLRGGRTKSQDQFTGDYTLIWEQDGKVGLATLDLNHGTLRMGLSSIDTREVHGLDGDLWGTRLMVGNSQNSANERDWLLLESVVGPTTFVSCADGNGRLASPIALPIWEGMRQYDIARIEDVNGDAIDDAILSQYRIEEDDDMRDKNRLAEALIVSGADGTVISSIRPAGIGSAVFEVDRRFVAGNEFIMLAVRTGPDPPFDAGEDAESLLYEVRVYSRRNGEGGDICFDLLWSVVNPNPALLDYFCGDPQLISVGGSLCVLAYHRSDDFVYAVNCESGELMWTLRGSEQSTRWDTDFGEFILPEEKDGGQNPRALIWGVEPNPEEGGRPTVDVVNLTTGEVQFSIDLEESPPTSFPPQAR